MLDVGIDNLARLLTDVVRSETVVFNTRIKLPVFDVTQIDRTALTVAVAWKEPLHFTA